ncbi:TPA: hypothetical protein ACOM2X_005248, partial [Escherichia coli]
LVAIFVGARGFFKMLASVFKNQFYAFNFLENYLFAFAFPPKIFHSLGKRLVSDNIFAIRPASGVGVELPSQNR